VSRDEMGARFHDTRPQPAPRWRGGILSTDPLFDLSGRVAIVTGGLGQLGSTYVAGLAERGMRVASFDVASGDVPEGVRAYEVDVTERAGIEEAALAVEEEWGVPHLLVNNAGLDAPPDAPAEEVGAFETYPEASFDSVLDVNVKGPFLCSQVVGGAMARAGRGSIVNVSSVYGLLSPVQDLYEFRREQGETYFKPVAYSVSKAAVLNLTRYLATYWAKSGVRVNTLTLAGVWNDQPAPFLEAFAARSPLGRMLDAGEALGALVFLASDASSYVTGANVVVDGGWSAW
jgi:NAD(P)-dependent dehydrogenase (short-subunit alcohol dehydrogenase family)